MAETLRQITDDPRIDARVPGRINRLVDLDHASFDVAHYAFFFFLQASGKDDVRVMCCFGHEKIDHAEEFQLLERFADVSWHRAATPAD